MVNIVPVDRRRHSGKGWRPSHAYAFASSQSAVPLVGAEFAAAAVAMPIAFMQHEGRYVAVAVLSPIQGRNFFVAPNGHWLGNYVPAALRSYPFRLARAEDSDQFMLCIDEDSGWVVDANVGEGVAKFFEEDGSPSAGAQAIVGLLKEIEQNRATTELAMTDLAEAGVIQPWPLHIKEGDQEVAVKGLYRIDAAALAALDDETFLKLRRSSALTLAHAQLISLQTLGVFQQLRAVQERLAQQAKPLPSVSSLFPTDDGGTIRFN
jgi:hypothetical protein